VDAEKYVHPKPEEVQEHGNEIFLNLHARCAALFYVAVEHIALTIVLTPPTTASISIAGERYAAAHRGQVPAKEKNEELE
jgi:hypothetical protein